MLAYRATCPLLHRQDGGSFIVVSPMGSTEGEGLGAGGLWPMAMARNLCRDKHVFSFLFGFCFFCCIVGIQYVYRVSVYLLLRQKPVPVAIRSGAAEVERKLISRAGPFTLSCRALHI